MARLDAPRFAGLFGVAVAIGVGSWTVDPAPTPTPAPTPAPALAPTPTPDPRPTPVAPPTLTVALRVPLQVRDLGLAFRDLRFTAPDIAPNASLRLAGTRRSGAFAARAPALVIHYASWCRPCADELPDVLALAHRLSSISKFETVFVSHDAASGPEALLASFEDLVAKAGVHAPALPPRTSLRADPRGAWSTTLARTRAVTSDPEALPQLWLLDARGRLRAHLHGPLTAAHAELIADLAKVLVTPARGRK